MAPANESTTESVVQAFLALPQLAKEQTDLQRRGRFLSCDFELGVGAEQIALRIDDGMVTAARRGPFLLKSSDFSVRAGAEDWLQFLQVEPAPEFHDLMAMTKAGRARIEGNLLPFMGNLQVIKDIVALPRGLVSSGVKA